MPIYNLSALLPWEKFLIFRHGKYRGSMPEEILRLLLSENETGINGMNEPIQLCGHGNTAGALFCGYPEKVEIKEEKGYRIADIQAVSGTILLDQKKSNRVFQKKVQTYMGIASTVTADTEHSACILPGSDMRTGGTLIQYQETDWRFLKRMAPQLGLPLVPDTSYYYPRFYLGLPEGEKRELGEIISCNLCFDGRYYAVSGKCLVDREDFICYDVVTRTSLSLGDRVTLKEGSCLFLEKKQNWRRGGHLYIPPLWETVIRGFHGRITRTIRDCHAGNVGYHGIVCRRGIQSLCERQCGYAGQAGRNISQ